LGIRHWTKNWSFLPLHKDDSADDRPKRFKDLPARYNGRTKLEYEVRAGGTDSADFQLTSP